MTSMQLDKLTAPLLYSGWKRRFFLVFLGLILNLAFAPLFWWPFGVVSLSYLWLIIIRFKQKKPAFWDGWWFGFGHFSGMIYWFAFALLTDAEKFAWMIPFAIFGIGGCLAFFMALFTLACSYFPQAYRSVGVFVCWFAMEWLRSSILTGFPWNLLGYSLGFSDSLLQIASVFGIWGVSLLALLLFITPVLAVQLDDNTWSFRARGLILPVVIIGLCFGWGSYRLSQQERMPSSEKTIRIVQAGIAQGDKWDPNLREKHLQDYVALSSRNALQPPSYIIWPESAVSYFLDHNAPLRRDIASALPEGATLITGGLHGSFNEYGGLETIFNSIFVIDSHGSIQHRYDKKHLVPFGEYVPLRNILPIEKLTYGTLDYSAGTNREGFTLEGLSLSPLICYEAIFPGTVNTDTNDADLLINITNDAWFGRSSAPYHHLQMVRLRAIEEGRPVIRVANTGISALFDSYGRVLFESNLEEKVVKDLPFPQPQKVLTFFSALGILPIIVLLLFCQCGIIIFRRSKDFT